MKAFGSFFLALHVAAAAARSTRRDTCPEQNATVSALTYGLPSLAFRAAVVGNANGSGANKFVVSPPISPNDTSVVSPNVDTRYVNMGFDISSTDIKLIIPEIDDRYYSVSFYTPFGENYVTFGAQDGQMNGTYLLTMATSNDNAGTLDTHPKDDDYDGIIYATCTQGLLLVRIVQMNLEDDVAVVTKMGEGFKAELVSRDDQVGPSLAANKELFSNTSTSQAGYIMNLTSWFQKTIPEFEGNNSALLPTSTKDMLSEAGMGNATYDKPPCVDLTGALRTAAGNIQKGALTALKDMGHKWGLPTTMGQYGTNYEARAAVAMWGYLAMDTDVALYPKYSNSRLKLKSNESMTMKFSSKPPLRDDGFWSVTMYNVTGYLVNNKLNRYSVGDRGNLTYDDGQKVYGSGEDKSFEVLIQADEPPEEYISNWLPSPSDGGVFNIIMRFYYPEDSLSDGSWEYPAVEMGAAVTKSSDSSSDGDDSDDRDDNSGDDSDNSGNQGGGTNPGSRLRSCSSALVLAALLTSGALVLL